MGSRDFTNLACDSQGKTAFRKGGVLLAAPEICLYLMHFPSLSGYNNACLCGIR
jgi:hypothetical protein